MVNNYEVAYNEEWSKLEKLNLEDISKRLNIIYDKESKELIIPFFKNNYRLNLSNKEIYKEEDNSKLSVMHSIVMLNYLTYSQKEILEDNTWVSLKEIPNGGVLFYPAFYKSSIQPLIKRFDNKTSEFIEKSNYLKGNKIKFGDIAYEFEVLPKVKIGVVYWQGDDEISSNATVLFNPSIQDIMHIETIIGVGGYVVDELIR